MANRRTGPSRGQRGRPNTLPWRADPEILERIKQVANLRATGLTHAEVAAKLGVSLDAVKDDWRRLRELRTEEATGALDEHIEALQRLKAELHRELRRLVHLPGRGDMPDQVVESAERARLYAQIRQIEMDLAKLDGSLVERKELSGKDGAPLTFTLEIPKPTAG